MEYLERVLGLLQKYPDVGAAVLGILFSMAATQFIKKMLPDSWSDELYKKVVRGVGFVTGWVFAHGAWVILDPSSSHFERIYMSAGCGFASPGIYTIISSYVMHKYPWFDAVFSGRPKVQNAGSPPKAD